MQVRFECSECRVVNFTGSGSEPDVLVCSACGATYPPEHFSDLATKPPSKLIVILGALFTFPVATFAALAGAALAADSEVELLVGFCVYYIVAALAVWLVSKFAREAWDQWRHVPSRLIVSFVALVLAWPFAIVFLLFIAGLQGMH